MIKHCMLRYGTVQYNVNNVNIISYRTVSYSVVMVLCGAECCAMLCYAVLYCAMLCYAPLCCAMLCYAVLWYTSTRVFGTTPTLPWESSASHQPSSLKITIKYTQRARISSRCNLTHYLTNLASLIVKISPVFILKSSFISPSKSLIARTWKTYKRRKNLYTYFHFIESVFFLVLREAYIYI